MGSKLVPKHKIKFTISIKGEKWKVKLLHESEFVKYWPGYLGVTVFSSAKESKVIYLKGPRVSRDTIAHELLHAFLHNRHFGGMSCGQIEESVCEEVGKSHKKIYQLTNHIHKKLTRKTKRAA